MLAVKSEICSARGAKRLFTSLSSATAAWLTAPRLSTCDANWSSCRCSCSRLLLPSKSMLSVFGTGILRLVNCSPINATFCLASANAVSVVWYCCCSWLNCCWDSCTPNCAWCSSVSMVFKVIVNCVTLSLAVCSCVESTVSCCCSCGKRACCSLILWLSSCCSLVNLAWSCKALASCCSLAVICNCPVASVWVMRFCCCSSSRCWLANWFKRSSSDWRSLICCCNCGCKCESVLLSS